ncbi:MAG: protein-arginine deiminase family protein [Myxococcota bacterium]
MRTSAVLLAASASFGSACGLFGPGASLTVSERQGRAPLAVILDASASSGDALRYRFDFDGDGVWDTAWVEEPVVEGVLERAGDFTPVVEVMDTAGNRAVAASPEAITVTVALIDIDADANRDGTVTTGDKSDEDSWTEARGGVFLSNWDDDDGDGVRDARDQWVNGSDDLVDMAPLLLRHSPDLPAGARVTLEISPSEAAARVRLFLDGTRELLLDTEQVTASLAASALREGDILLRLEGVGGRSGNWDGVVRVTATATDGDAVLATDAVELRAAPTIFPDNTQKAEELYVMRISDWNYGPNLPFYNALVAGLPADVPLYTVDQYEYYGDRWVQDNMQPGYQQIPVDGDVKTQLNFLETQRQSGGGLESLVPTELLSVAFGFVFTGGIETSLNYGGNLEVTPPHQANGNEFPFGRIFIGGGAGGTILGSAYEDHMNDEQRGYLEAQEVQGPVIELSSEWLAVGHIDEVLLFIPDTQRTDRPWRVAIASPDLARASLRKVQGLGGGAEKVFAGRETETTVDAILGDEDLLAYNDLVQARIDSIRDRLAAEMELNDDDFVELPVLFEPLYFGGQDFGIAYNPGMQNLVVVDNQLFIPDPEGPTSAGKDAWQQAAVESLAATGLVSTFVDVFESYHLLMGEAHCGTNVRNAPYGEEWWQP